MKNYVKALNYYRRISEYQKPYAILYIFCTLLNSLMLFLVFSSVGVLLREILNVSVENFDKNVLLKFGLYIIGILVFSFCSSFTLIGFVYIEQKIQRKLRTDILDAYFEGKADKISKFSSSEIHTRITVDLPKCVRLVGYYMEGWIYAPILSGAFSLLTLFVVDVRVGILTLFCAGLNLCTTKLFSHRQSRLNAEIVEKKSHLYHYIQESIDGNTEIKIFDLGKNFENKVQTVLEGLKKQLLACNLYQSFRNSITIISADCITIVSLLLLGNILAERGILNFGDIMLALPLSDQINQMLVAIGNFFTILKINEAYLKRVFDVIDIEKESDLTNEDETDNHLEKEPKLSLKNISFSYENKKILNHINLEIPFGKSVAIVGESGGGKSTILKLLLRLYPLTDGKIMFAERDAEGIDVRSWRKYFSYMPQNNTFFQKSIVENICMGKPVDQDKMKNISDITEISEFIKEKRDGYDTVLGKENEAFSGGQLQRIALARTLYKNAPIFLLDEPVSALDTETGNSIKRLLEGQKGKCTMIVVTHRLELTENFDQIVVLDKGQLVESGTHEELLKINGIYRKMWISQQI